MGEVTTYAFRRTIGGEEKYVIAGATPNGISFEHDYARNARNDDEKDPFQPVIHAIEELYEKGCDIEYTEFPEQVPDIRRVNGKLEQNDPLSPREQARIEMLLKQTDDKLSTKQTNENALYVFQIDGGYTTLEYDSEGSEIPMDYYKPIDMLRTVLEISDSGYSIHLSVPKDFNHKGAKKLDEDERELILEAIIEYREALSKTNGSNGYKKSALEKSLDILDDYKDGKRGQDVPQVPTDENIYEPYQPTDEPDDIFIQFCIETSKEEPKKKLINANGNLTELEEFPEDLTELPEHE
jgi:hypothetical protein